MIFLLPRFMPMKNVIHESNGLIDRRLGKTKLGATLFPFRTKLHGYVIDAIQKEVASHSYPNLLMTIYDEIFPVSLMSRFLMGD